MLGYRGQCIAAEITGTTLRLRVDGGRVGGRWVSRVDPCVTLYYITLYYSLVYITIYYSLDEASIIYALVLLFRSMPLLCYEQ